MKLPLCFSLFRHAGVALLLAAGFAGSANASVVVDLGGDMVTTTRGLVLPTPTDTTGGVRTWSWNTTSGAISPVVGYTGPAFWGALQTKSASGTPANFSVARITNSGTADTLDLWGAGTGTTSTMDGLIFFKPDVAGGTTVSFDATSSMTLTISTFNYNPRSARMAVLSNGVWYLSKTQVTGATTFTLANLDTSLWGAWNGVENAAPLPGLPASYDVAGSSFTSIDAVGFYFSAAGTASGTPRLTVTGFTVDALTSIPEPSSLACLALGLGALAVVRQRRKAA